MFTTEVGSFGSVGFTTGLILPYLDRVLWACIFYYACGYLITRADDLLGVRIFYYACYLTPTAPLY